MANTKQGGAGNIIKLALVLLAVAAVIALVLGFVNSITEGPIKAYNDNKTKTAYSNVLEAETYDEIDPAAYAEANGENTITLLKEAKDGSGNVVGYVAETEFSGAQGMITMVIGLDNDLKCTGIYVTKHSETSGLGAKAAETSEGAWRDNLLGQGDGLKLTSAGGEVNAISGATITSTAVFTEVQTVINAVKNLG